MQTSFIPKKSHEQRKVKKRNSGGLLMGISGIIFIFSILSSGTIFLYNRYLMSEIENMSGVLEREKGSLEKEIIIELSKIDKRIEASKKILDKHMTLAPLFELLEQNTLKAVRFKQLFLNPVDGKWVLTMSGTASSYATIALQSDIFGENSNMSELIFCNLGVGTDGGVIFDISVNIDSRLLSYRNSLE